MDEIDFGSLLNRWLALSLLLFCTRSYAARSELAILKPCFESLAESPNSELAPKPRGNSFFVGVAGGYSKLVQPLNFSFDTVVLPVRRAGKGTDNYELHVFKDDSSGVLRVTKYKISASALANQKGVVLPIEAQCSRSFFSSLKIFLLDPCWSMPLTLDIGTYAASSYDSVHKASKYTKIIMSKHIVERSVIHEMQKNQTEH